MRKTTRQRGLSRSVLHIPESNADVIAHFRNYRDPVQVSIEEGRKLAAEARAHPRLPKWKKSAAKELKEKADQLERFYRAKAAGPAVLAALEFATRFYMLLHAVSGIDAAAMKYALTLRNLDRKKFTDRQLHQVLKVATSDAHAVGIFLNRYGIEVSRVTVTRRRNALGLKPGQKK